jgi:UDP-N-acetyl-D-glucosamine dehydrogenase
MSLLERVQKKECKVGVIGLGYVGLPLAVELALGGFHVTGFDVDGWKVAELNAGRSYIPDVPSADLAKVVASGRFRAMTNMAALAEMDCIDIAVPTPLRKTKDPDMSYVVQAVEAVKQHLRKGQLVSLESTTYPGTTDELVKPMLEETGLKAGEDFYLAFSPERVDPANPQYLTKNIPKVVGGIDKASTDIACALYGSVVTKTVPVSSTVVAEMAKLLENTFRSVNIGMVNELALMCHRMHIDVWEVIDAARTKPFGFMPFYPGPGLGGHCIPIDPFYLSWKARQYGLTTRFIELAGEVNVAMPRYVITRLMEALNDRGRSLKGSRILVLGLAYKKDIDDVRESPSLELIELLRHYGAKADYNDPHVPRTHKMREHDLKMSSVPLSAASLRRYDAVVISTDHSAYDYPFIVDNSRLVIDTRNATKDVKRGRGKIVKA